MTERFTGERYSPWHLFRKPEPYPIDRSLEQELAIEFRSPDRNREREKALAVAIIQSNTSGLSYHDAFQRLFNLFVRINSIHFGARKGALSKTRSDAKFNTIQSHMIARLALDRAMEVPDDYLDKLDLQEASLSSTDGVDTVDNWYAPKVDWLANEIRASKWTRGWIKRLSERVGPAIKGREGEIKQDAEEVWKQVVADRAYGVKNCFFESPLFHNDTHVFYVMDRSLGFEDPLMKEYLPSDTEVLLGIGEKPKGMTPQPQVSDIKIGNTIKYHRIKFGSLHTIYAVTNKGDIRTNVINLFSLRESFEAEGNVGLFHLLRLFMFMRLYDLTARAVTVNKLPSIGRLEGEIARNRTGLLRLGKEVKPFNYKTLLLPRVKPIIDEPEPVLQTPDQSEEQVRHFVDRHKVTWFTRRLPEGYHASETAKQYALEHGVTLKEQETIVREHFRGKETNKPERPIKAEFRRKK